MGNIQLSSHTDLYNFVIDGFLLVITTVSETLTPLLNGNKYRETWGQRRPELS